MAARFTLASGITEKLDTFSAYISTFSKRSLSLLLLLTATISVCFLYSSQSPNLLSGTTDGFRYAHNESHLLSPGKYDCARCEKPLDNYYYNYHKKLEPKQIWDACLDRGVVPEYYLTVVMVARNDDYAGNQFHRLQNSIDSTFTLAEKTKTLIELLIIEWNPPAGRRRIRETYRFRRSAYLTYRIITVPRKIHETLRGEEGPDVLEYEGKNVGIRFARGEFIVSTNQDDVWSPNMHNAVVSRSFRKKMFYTQFQDSHTPYDDLPNTIVNVPSFITDDGLLEACGHDAYESHAFTFPSPQVMDTTNFLVIAHEASDFTLAHRDTWQLTHGYRETGAKTWMDMELLLTAAWTLDIPITYTRDTLSCHQQHQTVVHPNSDVDNQGVDVGKIMTKEEIHMNEQDQWGLQNIKLWEYGLQCEVFRGGLGL